MVDWLPGGREQARRVEALEREVENLRASSTGAAERHQEAASKLDALVGQVSALTEKLDAVARSDADRAATLILATAELERLRRLDDKVLQLEIKLANLEAIAGPEAVKAGAERAKGDAETLIKMQTALKRAERQLDVYAEQSRKTAAALLERIELRRVSQAAEPPVRQNADPA